ncbi:2-amino-4-hydroxy-6-hydroxymethyldihydropteridine diphosphokinase [Roseomonas elaeocarpi]|uniref:2-amino-4-hydroxy-6-hydroxymethyldihydropteridine pyrophosphokinase n=1 Tax=Roseomonas elaeocarpi TaxID=907779 RepID=A0ABV6JXH2_9PROT
MSHPPSIDFPDTLVALGANLPGEDGQGPLETCRRAAAALDGICGLPLVAVSNWWETPPDPPDPDSPPYVNGVARLRGVAPPELLLEATQSIENRMGRVRSRPNAPRTLDLDLIAVGAFLRETPDPILPHPRARLRRFVLCPLAEVAPEWRNPRTGETLEEMIRAAPPMLMRRL